MKLGTIVTSSFVLSFIIAFIGAWLKIIHSPSAEIALFIGIAATLVFVVTAIYEVRTSPKIGNIEKTLWTLAFIFFSGITRLIYFFIRRKRIARNS
jgi:hypothetical protein